MITIGIDPHKSSLTAVALELAGGVLGQVRLAVTADAGNQLMAFAGQWPDRQWAIKGATGLGRGVALALAADAETVLDVPAKLAARARLLTTGHGRKTDTADATSVAAVAQRHNNLRQVQPEDHTVELRLLSDHRDDLVAERTRTLNRLHRLLRELIPRRRQRDLSTNQAALLIRGLRPRTSADACRGHLARDLLTALRRLDAAIKDLTQRITEAVAQARTSLTDIRGVGPIVAAKILGHIGDVRRFPDRHRYASYTGTAPIEASSGENVRHRLSRLGNRQLNAAIHIIALCQTTAPGPRARSLPAQARRGQDPERSPAQPQTGLTGVVYRHLLYDQEHPS